MEPEFIPIVSAVISAAVAFLVSWFSSRWAVRLETDKLRLSTQQLAFSKLLDVRIREYPALYSILSDLPKAAQGKGEASALDLKQVLSRVNDWDSRHSIFLGPDTSNICYAFRAVLHEGATSESPSTTMAQLLDAAERLELALRSDIGIHGIALSESDLSPRQRKRY